MEARPQVKNFQVSDRKLISQGDQPLSDWASPQQEEYKSVNLAKNRKGPRSDLLLLLYQVKMVTQLSFKGIFYTCGIVLVKFLKMK